jgi:hypothetical protein
MPSGGLAWQTCHSPGYYAKLVIMANVPLPRLLYAKLVTMANVPLPAAWRTAGCRLTSAPICLGKGKVCAGRFNISDLS